MVKNFIKYITRQNNREILNKVILDIESKNISSYDVVKLNGYVNLFRVRIGKTRIVYRATENGNVIVAVNTRGDIYKGF